MKTAVILHGWASNPDHWTKFIRELKASGFKVLKPDLPGFRTAITRPYTTQDYVDWLKNYLSGKGKVILIGQSFGGQIAIQFAAQHQERLEQLVLIGAAGIRRQFGLKKHLFWLLSKVGKELTTAPLARKLLYRLAREHDYLNASPIMKKTLQLIVKEDQQENLRKITLPTLLLWGSRDRYTPVKQGLIMHRLLQNSTWQVFEGEGHGLHFTRPKDLVKAIAKFCQ